MTLVGEKGRMWGFDTNSRPQSGTKASFHVRIAVIWAFEWVPGWLIQTLADGAE